MTKQLSFITEDLPSTNKEVTQPTKKSAFTVMKAVAKRPLRLFRQASSRSVNSTGTETIEMDKCVSLSSQTIEYYTIARKDYSPKEIKATWYTDEEYNTISRQCCKQIKKMDGGEKLKDKKYCARGLEAHTRFGSIAKSKNKAESIRSVLREQDMQLLEGRYDDEAIGKAYHQRTSSSQMWASVVGLRDQRSSENYLDDVDVDVDVEVEVSMPQTIPSVRRQQKRIQPSGRPLAGTNKFTVLARSA
jgi:hypothetical protein